MNRPYLTFKLRLALMTSLFAAIIALGVVFIINNQQAVHISLIVLGSLIIVASIFMLIVFIRNYQRLKLASSTQQFPILSSPFLIIFLIVMTTLSGLAIIFNAKDGMGFYQSALASILFFRSIHRFFYAYLAKKSQNKRKAIYLLIAAVITLVVASFLSLYTANIMVIALVSGISIILEGLYGLYRTWSFKFKSKTRAYGYRGNQGFYANQGGYHANNQGFYGKNKGFSDDNQADRIVITDYEIVEDGQNIGTDNKGDEDEQNINTDNK